MKILVTGALGTLGIPLSKELRRRGHVVRGIDLFHSLEAERCDIRERRQVHNVFLDFRPEAVYHLAAEFGRVNGSMFYEQMWSTNVLGTQNIIEDCLAFDSRLIFASSSEAYGRLADSGVLTEDLLDSVAPEFHNIYALGKWTNERQIRLAEGLRWVIMRIFNVYGPGEHPNSYRSVVARFLWAKMQRNSEGVTRDAKRQFLFVDDFVNTACNIAESSANRVSVNIAGEECISIKELADKIGVLYAMTTDPSNVSSKQADTSLARDLFGHNPVVSLEEGLRRTEEWMDAYYADYRREAVDVHVIRKQRD